jgi:crossover junction endodeoxyribonuclease RuvC
VIIIGIDPGIAISGYGVVEYKNNKFRVIEYGAVTTESDTPFPQRLKILYDEYINIFREYEPEAVAIEELFFNKNVKTAINVGQARGVHLLAAVNCGINVYEYTPLQVKQGVVGYGRAEKRQIQEMVKILLNLKQIPKPDDVADALAVAICHAHSGGFQDMFRIR